VVSGPGLSLPPSALVGPPSPARGLAGLAPPHGANAWDTDRVQINTHRNLNQNQPPSVPPSHNLVGGHSRPQNQDCRSKVCVHFSRLAAFRSALLLKTLKEKIGTPNTVTTPCITVSIVSIIFCFFANISKHSMYKSKRRININNVIIKIINYEGLEIRIIKELIEQFQCQGQEK